MNVLIVYTILEENIANDVLMVSMVMQLSGAIVANVIVNNVVLKFVITRPEVARAKAM